MGVMKLRQVLHRKLVGIPAPLAVAAGFALIIAASFLIAAVLPPPRDVQAECRTQCEPRLFRLVTDKNYPMSAKGTYRQICECF